MVSIETENKNFVRDLHSKALLFNNKSERDDYLARKKLIDRQKKLEEDVASLKDDLQEIKELLKKVTK